MKNSIAKKISRQIANFIIIALLVLFVSSFLLVRHVISTKNEDYSRAVVTFYTDLMINEAEKENVPLNPQNSEIAKKMGDYICKWYSVDCAFLGVPDTDKGTLTYTCVSYNGNFSDEGKRKTLINYEDEYPLEGDVLKVWEGKKTFAFVPVDTTMGTQICTFIKISDSFGNDYLAGVDISYKENYMQIIKSFSMIAGIMVLVMVCVYVGLYHTIRQKVSKPAKIISKTMNDFISDGKKTATKLEEKGFYSEYVMISRAFNQMTKNINDYLQNINALTREQERQNTEFQIAAGIQEGFLPKKYLLSDYYELRSVMQPAKDIGGDLYDYVAIDENRVLLVVADVSGKGISAALFMAITLMIIREYAKLNLSPDQILCRTNDALSENNTHLFFATAFVGIFDTRDNSFTYSNAGHNHPYLVGKNPKELDKACGTLLGLFPGEEYTCATEYLKTGDTLLIYTDGVTEAINKDKEFFGEERLKGALSRFKAAHFDNLVSYCLHSVEKFEDGTEQFDDITMLSLSVKETNDILLSYDITEFERIKKIILSLPVSREMQLNLCLAAEECFVNICNYAFEDKVPKDEKIRFVLSVSDRIYIRFEDGGQEYNPIESLPLAEDYDLDTQIGGLGKLMAVKCVDNINYEYKDGKNVLTLIKYFEEEE